MSSGMSSDQIIKYEIKDKVKKIPGIELRIFPDSSNQDQLLVAEGGLTFSVDNINYGSCDAGWFVLDADGRPTIPFIGLEGTDALNRGSSGDAQYQRFHHALGAVKQGRIGIYYLREGSSIVQPDLYEMAYNATIHEKGAYLIIQDLSVVSKILELAKQYGVASKELNDFVMKEAKKMHDFWYEHKFSTYNYDWKVFAENRSTLLYDDYIIKYAGRMKRNFTDGSQRAGHIAVGEMYLSKYLFYGKKVYYLCPRMSKADVEYLDKNKSYDKEWTLLRHEPDVFFVTRDDIIGLKSSVEKSLISISESPMKTGSDVYYIYKDCIADIVSGLKAGTYQLRMEEISVDYKSHFKL